MTNLEIKRAVERLDEIHADTETAHSEADQVLLDFVPREVSDAWVRCYERHEGFWYA